MSSPLKSYSSFERVSTVRVSRVPTTALDWGVELRLWVATCVTGLSLYSARASGLVLDRTTISALAITFFATLALYNLDGSLDAPTRHAVADAAEGNTLRRLHLALTGLASISLLVLVAQLSLRALLLTGGGALVCSLYAIPVTLTRKASTSSFRLKALPFLKAPFVGCAVGTAVVWVPLWANGGRVSFLQAIALTSALAFYCTANALLFDIPDVEEDDQTGVPTLPVRWGLHRTRWVNRALVTAGLLSSVAFAALFGADSHAVGLFCLGFALLAFTESFHFRTPRRTVALWVDGALLLPLSFQVLLNH